MYLHKFRMILAGGTCLVWAFNAHAEELAAEATAPIAAVNVNDADIVVTAQRREQRLQDVPIAVTVTTGAKIDQLGIRDLPDLSTRTPGLKLGPQLLSDALTIRGVGSGFNLGFEQGVGTFIDGIYRGRSRASRAALFDVERVEILKGPQTTFFGNNTIVGALNITTRKAGDDLEYNGQLLYAPSDGEYIAEGAVSVPVTPELGLRAGVKFSGMDGFNYNENLKRDEPRMRDWIGRISLRWTPSDSFRSDLRVDRSRNRATGTYGAEIKGCPPDPKYGAPSPNGNCGLYLAANGGLIDDRLDFRTDVGPSGFRLDLLEIGWTNRLELGAVTLSAISSYYHHKQRNALQVVPLALPGGRAVNGVIIPNGAASRSPATNVERYTSYSQEIRAESAANGPLQWMLGAYYSHGKLAAGTYTAYYAAGLGALVSAVDPSFTADTRVASNRNIYQIDETRSVFGSGTWRILDPLRLNAGVRYTSVRKRGGRSTFIGRGGVIWPGPEDFVPASAAVQAVLGAPTVLNISSAPFNDPKTTYSRLLPSASLQYDLSDNATAYASYSKGFKSGGYADANLPVQFGSEYVDAYEVGVKGSLFDRAVYFSIDAFWSRYTDLQEAVNLLNNQGVVIAFVSNVAKSDSKGIEFNGSWRVSDNLTFTTDVAYIDSKYTSFPGGPCNGYESFLGASGGCVNAAADRSGDERAFAPKFSASIGASLTIPLDSRNVLRIDPNLYYSSKYYLNPTHDEDFAQGKYAKLDVRAGIGPDDRSWELAVIGKNLTNTKIISMGFTGVSPGTIQALLERQRSVAISFSIRR